MFFAVAVWVAVTEEYIFRGLCISVIRRWAIFPRQSQRNALAITLSAVLFGAAHYPTWGLAAAIALTGLGFGFSLAYLANREQIMPVIVYHFIFDLCSILLTTQLS